ncbi:MAG: flagellar basal body rod protein FlgB [Myxococcaceae bacterium]
MKLFDRTLGRLESSLDVRLEQQNVLNGNLANVDTPGYVPRELDFDAALRSAEQSKEAGAAPRSPTEFVKTAEEVHGGLDGNAVDLDKTMVELARNSLLYGAAAKTAGKKLSILKYVASDGVG